MTASRLPLPPLLPSGRQARHQRAELPALQVVLDQDAARVHQVDCTGGRRRRTLLVSAAEGDVAWWQRWHASHELFRRLPRAANSCEC